MIKFTGQDELVFVFIFLVNCSWTARDLMQKLAKKIPGEWSRRESLLRITGIRETLGTSLVQNLITKETWMEYGFVQRSTRFVGYRFKSLD